MKYEPPWAFCAPVLDEGVLVPRVQWLLPASVQPQIDVPLSKPHTSSGAKADFQLHPYREYD